jgi:Putative lumazine-binding
MRRYRWLSIAFAISLFSGLATAGAVTLYHRPAQVNISGSSSQATSSTAEAESAAIRQTALDYIVGFYDGDADRMERAVHPELAKRIVRTDAKNGRSRLDQMSAMALVQGTRAGYGKNIPQESRQKDVSILDIFEQAASVKIVASDWVDYLHMAKFNGRWVIVNVLWELKPEKR